MHFKYRLNEPYLKGKEKEYVLDVLESGWLSVKGKHTVAFEQEFSDLIGLKYGLAVQSGTAALHTALLALGVEKGDCVVVPNYTCGACATSVMQCGAKPVILDVERQTFGLDYFKLKDYLDKTKTIPKAVMAVHVYGFPARDTEKIAKLCREHGISFLEDCSEAHGAKINGRCVGTFGDIATFSLRSEKMIGVGEGGIILSNSKDLIGNANYWASRAAPYRTGSDPYWMTYYYTGVGMNYMMPHVLGAIARGQVENFQEILRRKKAVGMAYHELFKGFRDVTTQKIIKGHEPVFWLNCITLNELNIDQVRSIGLELMKLGIEIRPGFIPLGTLPPFKGTAHGDQNVGTEIYEKSIILPSSVYLADDNCMPVNEITRLFNLCVSAV